MSMCVSDEDLDFCMSFCNWACVYVSVRVTFIAAVVKVFPSWCVLDLRPVVFVFDCVFIHAPLQCECFHKQRQGVKCLFEHMLESLLRAVWLSAAIPSASGDTLGAVQLSLSFSLSLPPLFNYQPVCLAPSCLLSHKIKPCSH